MKYRIVALFFFALLLGAYGSDRQIALAYLDRITELWDGDRRVAENLIDKGLVYDDSLSGLWFLRGQLEEEKRDYPGALASYGKARERDDWDGGDYDGFIDAYFSLLLSLHRWDEVLLREGELPYQKKTRAQVLHASGWSLLYLGEKKEALDRSVRGMDLYPGDWRFFALAVAAGGTDWLPSLIHYWGNDPQVMARTVEMLYKGDVLPYGLREWYEKKDDSLAKYLRLDRALAEKTGDGDALLKAYLETEPTDLLFLNRLARSESDSLRGEVNSYVLGIGKILTYDREGDLFPEMEFSQDRIFSRDDDGDGVWDRRVGLNEKGDPLFWERELRGDSLGLEYFSWPYVRTARRTNGGREQDFDYLYPRFSLTTESLVPGKAFRDETRPEPLEWVDFLLEEDMNPPFQTLLKNCRHIAESSEGMLRRIYHITGGQVYALEEDPEGEGRLSRQVLIENGLISAARRDLDGDGVFDLFEYYEKGRWTGYAVNADGAGRSEFFEDWTLIPLKIWDYDGDSFMDGYLAGPYGEKTVTIVPHRDDPRDVGDYLQWERKFESKWYR